MVEAFQFELAALSAGFNERFRRFVGYFRPQTAVVPVERAAFAIIMGGEGSDSRFLLQWNEHWGMYNLVGGKLDNALGDGNSLARTLRRELQEELGLSDASDFKIGGRVKRIVLRQFSRRDRIEKSYRFGIFNVELSPKIFQQFNQPATQNWLSFRNRMVSKREICRLYTDGGQCISPTTRKILCILDLLTPCPSENACDARLQAAGN